MTYARFALVACALASFTNCTCRKTEPLNNPPPEPRGVPLKAPSENWLKGVPEKDTGSPKQGGTLIIRMPSEPAGLTRIHDRYADGLMVRTMVGTVYQTLATVNHQNPLAPLNPELAEKWSVSADGRQLTVLLKQGLQFHSGSPFSSADLLAELTVIRDVKNPTAGMRSALGDIEVIDAPDAQTLTVKWKKAEPLSVRTLLAGLPVMSAQSLQGDFETLKVHREPDGTGPYRVTEWKAGESLTLTHIEESRAANRAWLQSIELRFVKDETAAVQRWQSGEFDLMTRIPPQVFKAIEEPTAENQWAITGYQRLIVPENTYSLIVWNVRNPLLKDVRVRQALAAAYPGEVVAKNVDLGFEKRINCPYWPEGKSCDPSHPPPLFDLNRAKTLLDEAGATDTDGDGIRELKKQPLKLQILSNAASSKLAKLLPLYAEQLKLVGIELEINAVEPTAFVAKLRAHEFDGAPMSWSNLDVMTDVYDLFHSSQAKDGKNYGGFSDADLDRELLAVRVEGDLEQRELRERLVHGLIDDRQPALFLSTRPSLDAAKTRVHGLQPSVAWYRLAERVGRPVTLTRYALRRASLLGPTVLAVSVITFALAKMAPGDPFHLDAENVGAAVQLEQPSALAQYVHWLGGVARLDFGRSAIDQQPVLARILAALPSSLLLGTVSLVFAWSVALLLGIWLARRDTSRLARTINAGLAALYAVPPFWVAVLLLLLLATPRGVALFPLQGLPLSEGPMSLISHLILPVLCLSLPLISISTRSVSTAVSQALRSEFVRAARARGTPERAIVIGHALRASSGSLMAMLGLQLPHLVSGSVVIERVFGIHGMGLLAFEAVGQRDTPVILGVTVFLCLFTAVSMLIIDVLCAKADPRFATSLST